MSPDLDAALRHPLVQRHPLVKHLAGERERLGRAEAKHEQHQRAGEEYQGRLAAWRRACDQAVADAADLPPKPVPPDYDLGRAANAILQQKMALVEQARMLLADAAPDLVPQLAAEADKLLATTAKGAVTTLPRQMAALEQLRTILTAVAKCAWPHDVTGYRPLDHGQLVDLAISGQGSHARDWAAFLAEQQRRAEAEAAAAAEMATLADKAAEQQGRMVIGGPGTFGQPDVPPVDTRLAGRR